MNESQYTSMYNLQVSAYSQKLNADGKIEYSRCLLIGNIVIKFKSVATEEEATDWIANMEMELNRATNFHTLNPFCVDRNKTTGLEKGTKGWGHTDSEIK